MNDPFLFIKKIVICILDSACLPNRLFFGANCNLIEFVNYNYLNISIIILQFNIVRALQLSVGLSYFAALKKK